MIYSFIYHVCFVDRVCVGVIEQEAASSVSSVIVFCPQDVAFRGATRSSMSSCGSWLRVFSDVCCMYLHSFHTFWQHYWNSWLRNNLYDCSILIIAHFLSLYFGHLSCLMLLSSHLLFHSIRKCSLVTPLCSFHDISLPFAHICCILLNFLVHSVLKRLLIWLHWVI